MTPLHPKLNWETFERERARRKRRKFFWWFSAALGMLGLLALGVYSFTQQPEQPVLAEKAEQEMSGPQKQMQQEANAVAELPETEEPVLPSQPQRIVTRSAAAKSSEKSFANTPPARITTLPAQDKPVQEQPKETLENKEGSTAVREPIPTAVIMAEATAVVDQEASLPADVASEPSADSLTVALENIPNHQPSKRNAKVNSAWSVYLGWTPWHLAEFETAAPGASNLVYRPLNSINLGLGIDFYATSKMKLRLEPQFVFQRFQMQFEGDISAFEVAPGSVVGYLQGTKGIVVPVISDTVRGTSRVRAYQNGSLQELNVPVSMSTTLWNRGPLQLRLNLSAGLHYVFALRGSWFNGTEVYALQRPDNRLGLLGGGGLLFSYQPGLLVYQAGVSSMYRGATTDRQLPWRHQLQLSVAVPLRKR